MKAVYVERPGSIRIIDVPKPEIRSADGVLIRVICGGICGSDMGIFKGTNSLATYPRIIGHEFGGQVEAVGDGVRDIQAGDYVAVDPVNTCGHCYACTHGRPNVCSTLEVSGVHRDGGFAEYVVAPRANVYKVDTGKVPPELLCMIEPYSIGAEVNARARVAEGDRVLVMGSGPIGIGVMQVAKARGALVMMTDLIDERLERAVRMGADATLNTAHGDLQAAVGEFTGGEGMPVVVDTICQPWSLELAVSLTCPAGRVVTLGTNDKPSSIRQMDITKKELDVVGSRLSNRRFPEVIALMEAGKLTPEQMRTSTFNFLQAEEAMRQAIEHADRECKVTLSFN